MDIKKAAIINAIGKYTRIGLSVLVSAILARLLSAEDYGVVAIIMAFSAFFGTFSDMGFGTAIVQKKDLTDDDLNNIFSFSVYVGLILMILFSVLSYPISLFYKNPEFVKLGILLSFQLLFCSLDMVPNGVLSRDKKFTTISIGTVVIYVATSAVTILLAKLGLKYYALVIQSIISSLFLLIWDFSFANVRLGFRVRFDFGSIRKILNYSSYQMAFNFVNYFSRYLDSLLTGKYIGAADLGYYNKAYSLILYPVNNISGTISPVLHPILSDYQDRKDIIFEKHVKLVKLLACIGLFIAAVFFLAADEIIGIMYGDKWQNSITCFRILSLAIVPQMINGSAGSIFLSLGSTKLLFINGCINSAVTIIAIMIGVFWGKTIEILSICVAIAYIFHFVSASFMLSHYGFKYSLPKYCKAFIPEICIFIVMTAAVLLFPFRIESLVLSGLAKGLYLGVVFIASLFISKEHRVFKVLFH